MPEHTTRVEPLDDNTWCWVCVCGKRDGGYPNRNRAVNAAHLHRTMEMLKEVK